MIPDDDIGVIKGVGDKTARILNKLGVFTVGDLLAYYPRTYDVFGIPVGIAELKEGMIAAIECMVSTRSETIKTGRYIISTVRVSDPTGIIRLVWYNSPFATKQLSCGTRFIFRGRTVLKKGELIMTQPVIYTREAYLKKLQGLWPVYSLTAGITNNKFSGLVRSALEALPRMKDYLSASDRKRLNLFSQPEAIREIHFPVSKESCITAHKRLAFDEFVSFQALVRTMKEHRQEELNEYRVTDFSACEELLSGLPYELTNAQNRVIEEIENDLSGPALMSRMVQGDVGSGKTIVAVTALLAVVRAGYQGCIMCPTEVLARQHFESFTQLLKRFGVRCSLLTGSVSAAEKKKIYADAKSHNTDILIGTHALIQDKLEFDSLALAVIDEQHRFGVRQREMLARKGLRPHILAMSATPIPRSLAMILYGDLEISIIDEMPRNRLPVKNCVVDSGYRPTAYKFILKQHEIGHQAYIICPMVEDSEESDGENVVDYTDTLREIFKNTDIRIEYLHGKMKASEKNRIMEEFSSGEIDVLVSTTVVEVGVNVPNATVMMVENAERFGLAQLHQLRGRVGRGKDQSYCIFMKGMDSEDVNTRLNILVNFSDGMRVAEEDMKLRGPGDFFGTRQAGELEFAVADIYGDADMLKLAGEYVASMSEKELKVLADKCGDIQVM